MKLDDSLLLGDVAEFAGYMAEAEDWSAADLLYFLEKPWKWQAEFDAWVASGKP